MKKCARCKIDKPRSGFPRDSSKTDGFAYSCKECKAIERKIKRKSELERWHRYYAKGSEARRRHCIRSQTRRKHGSAKLHKCSMCGDGAKEWHHIEYKTDSVIPLCEPCHTHL